MNNTDWKILIYLREERSINKVAKRLFMTQPSLTYRLSQMEKEIGCPLFIRTNKGVHFTDAGARLFSFAEKELQQYQDMKNYVTHEPNSISGVLRIGASQSFSQELRVISSMIFVSSTVKPVWLLALCKFAYLKDDLGVLTGVNIQIIARLVTS